MTRTRANTSHRPLTERRLISIDDLATTLGVSVRHIRRLVSERRIPFHKWGRLLRFDVDEIERWIDASLVDASDWEAS